MVPLQQATRSVPIVFVNVADPVVPASSRAWRGRAATPLVFTREFGVSGKWLELLKEIAPA